MERSASGWDEDLALAERAAVLAWMWEVQSEGVLLMDAAGEVLDANPAAARIAGRPLQQLVGTGPDDPLWSHIRDEEGRAVTADRLPAGDPAPGQDGPPTLFSVDVPGAPERLVRARIDRRRTAGRDLRLVTFADVSEEIRARQAVERIAWAVEEFLFTARLHEGRLRVVYAGPGLERLLGGPVPEGMTVEAAYFAAVHPDDVERARQDVRDATTGRTVDTTYRLVGFDGVVRWVHSRATGRVEADGVHIDGMVADITAARRLRVEHEAIGNVATTVAAGADRDTILAAASREAARLLDAQAGGIATLDTGAAQLLDAWHDGAPGDELLRRALERMQPALHAEQASRAATVDAAHHCLGAPVRVDGAPWGAIVACRHGAPFDDADHRALERLGDLVGTALGVAGARDLLAHQAATDGLTGLSNHRAFHDALREEVHRAQRYERPAAIVLLDLDEFKSVNDRHGHQAGDQLLREVAAALQGVVRETETVARLGGDEFALLLPETGVDGAYATAERLRLAVEALPIAARHGVTASAGVADLGQATTADELVRLADGALYWSKVHGRNRVSAYDPERVEALSAQERVERLARTHALGAVRVLARLIDLKDRGTHLHSERVAALAAALARRLGWPEDRIAQLRDAALVHDVGKVVVPDGVLSKPGPLSDEEFALIREHPETGARIAGEALSADQARWIADHHERPDGTGYPAGLRGEEISEGGRILAFADGWDDMTGHRPYKPAMPASAAREECLVLAGTQFDARVVAAFEALWAAGAVDPMD